MNESLNEFILFLGSCIRGKFISIEFKVGIISPPAPTPNFGTSTGVLVGRAILLLFRGNGVNELMLLLGE